MSISEDEELTLYQAYLNSCDPRLIKSTDEGAPSVEFTFDGEWREYRIWEGYLDASLILLKKVLEQSPWSENLIFPALFKLRHAIEVALKWHIRYAGGAIPKRAGHDLFILIDAFRRTADDLDDDASYISAHMLNCISELAVVNPRSITFRYSTELDGSSIEISPEDWNLRHLYFMVSDLSVFLDDLSNRIDLSRNEEYQAYLRGD